MNEALAFSDVLKLLFKHRTRSDGTPYKAADVARGTGISPAQISLLLSGQRTNTSLEIATALLRFFDVSFDVLNATSEEEVIKLIDASKMKSESSFRLRGKLAQELSPRALRQIEQLIEYVLEREHAEREGQPLPPPPYLYDD
jgi:transcriptional regulator with XRE-family HTH domain